MYRCRSGLVAACVALGISVLPSSAIAQSTGAAPRSGGFWWSVAAAAAGARLTCDICDRTRDGGPSIEAAMGTYTGTSVRVGVEGGGWTFKDENFRETIYTAGVVAEVHPRRGSGLHLIGGLGWSGYRADDIEEDPEDVGFRYDALRLRLGVGWDLPMSGPWSVGSRFTVDASSLGTLHDEDAPIASSVGLSIVRFAVYLRYR